MNPVVNLCQQVHLNVLDLALPDQDIVEVDLFVGKHDLWRGDIGLQQYYCLRTVLDPNGKLQGSNSVRKPLPAPTAIYAEVNFSSRLATSICRSWDSLV